VTQAWYQVFSLVYGYAAAAAIAVIALLSLRATVRESRLWRRVRKGLPGGGAAGTLKVLSAGSRRLPAGTVLYVPYEGTMGSAHSCDVCIPYRKVHMRSAFFWMEKDALHMVALHRDGFFVDDVAVEPGDEAVMGDGTVLRVGELKMVLSLRGGEKERDMGPYVTSARRSKAQQGRGDGIGAPGKGEARREKKIQKRMKAQEEKETLTGAKSRRR